MIFKALGRLVFFFFLSSCLFLCILPPNPEQNQLIILASASFKYSLFSPELNYVNKVEI